MPRAKPSPDRSSTSRSRAPAAQLAETDTRVARRERRRERSREEILDAARRVLKRKGLAATTLDAVAREVGVSKPALYYYYPSKDVLLFELVFSILESNAQAVHEGVEATRDGGKALRAIVTEAVRALAPRLDDFRLAFLHGQVAERGAVHLDADRLARIRPLNELWFAGAAQRLSQEQRKRPGKAKVEPRLLAFLAFLSALGLLTMKGMVETANDPLRYTDEQIVEGFARVFEAAAAPD